ncbi:MAG: FAD-binding protein [Limnochordia bacterium]|jgi:electron transfer flavoprotein alpha subunit
MSGVQVDRELCTLCGSCIDACPFGAIEIEESQLVITDECRLCGACIEACPQGALSMQESRPAGAVVLDDYADVLVFVEQSAGEIHPVSYEMIGKGLELARSLGQKLHCIMAGDGISEQAADLLNYGVDTVYLYDDPALHCYRAEPYTTVVCELVQDIRPSIMLIGATHVGRSLAPRVATRLRTGLTADCTSLDVRENGELVQTRPAFGGNVMARIVTPNHRPQMATVRYKVMERAKRVDNPHGQVIKRTPASELTSGIEILDIVESATEASITEADIVVAVGRGACNERCLALATELAESLGGVVGASRPVVEQGLLSHTQQVGLSGRTVRPKLYVACGISGAVQHVAGMQGSDYIIAINKDRQAPIFEVADVAIVGDASEVLPHLIELIGGRGAHGNCSAS